VGRAAAPGAGWTVRRLDAWHRAREARQLALQYTASLPPGFGEESRQINKAAGSVVRNICEGAGRWRPAEKVLKFEIATGEAAETAGAVQSLLDVPIGEVALGQQCIDRMRQTSAILGGLIRRQRR
jgi:four helix bundle protein